MNQANKQTPFFKNPKLKWIIGAYIVILFGGAGVATLIGWEVPVVMWWRIFLYGFMFFGVLTFFFLTPERSDGNKPPEERGAPDH